MSFQSYQNANFTHELIDWEDKARSGIQAILFVDCCTAVVDPTDEVELQALLDSDSAIFVCGIHAQLPEPSVNTSTENAACGDIERVEDKTFTLTYVDTNYTAANHAAYNRVANGCYKPIYINCTTKGGTPILMYHDIKSNQFVINPVLEGNAQDGKYQYNVSLIWTAEKNGQAFDGLSPDLIDFFSCATECGS